MLIAYLELAKGNLTRNFSAFARALSEAGYRPETHLYLRGGHGFGMNKQGLSSDLWIDEFHAWMGAIGVIGTEP